MSPHTLADPLHERLLEAFPADTAYSPADWPADAMPGPLRHYLTQFLRHRAQQEAHRLQEARSRWANHDHPEVQEAAHPYFQAISDHPQVPAGQWPETLRTATRRTTAHLVRPVATLATFVFDDDAVAVPQILRRMRFFEPYDYLRDAVEAFATKRNRDRLAPPAFERVLRRIDERMAADFSPERWRELLAPLFDTARHATGQARVPLPLLRAFFKEKEAGSILDRLHTHEREQDTDTLSLSALQRLIEAARRDPSPTSDPDFSPTGQDLNAAASSTPPPSASEDTPSASPSDGATPMWKQFEQEAPRRSTSVDADPSDEAQPLWAQFRRDPSASDSAPNEAASPPHAPSTSPSSASSSPASASASSGDTTSANDQEDLTDLERAVFGQAPAPKRAVYVDALFEGDEAAYRQTLGRLRATDRWSDASQIIARDVFRAYQVNIYSDAAVHFTNAVEAGIKEN